MSRGCAEVPHAAAIQAEIKCANITPVGLEYGESMIESTSARRH